MISFLRGSVFAVGGSYVDVDVQGVGYRVHMTQTALSQLKAGQAVFLYTHQSVREDGVYLYGFPSEADRLWFELLIGVSGIGPKGALQILSGTSGEALAEAVYAEDVVALCQLPGVGKKTAQRLIVELRDKLAASRQPSWIRSGGAGTTGRAPVGTVQNDVIEALVALGYNERQASEEVRVVLSESPSLGVEDALRLCLQRLSR
ncbi:Holliday junction branch migration protein RuvA [Alicyclobacillus contaminans]|uniref:Holliday junction branch migration protein RuvA n=1 Tax=Alicyclobacillus contaminans TaxID=392016 RepID=UPI0003F8E647|nr:Holliday junction branch migration protein RuvA [Alicyclobacillus contaminans]